MCVGVDHYTSHKFCMHVYVCQLGEEGKRNGKSNSQDVAEEEKARRSDMGGSEGLTHAVTDGCSPG